MDCPIHGVPMREGQDGSWFHKNGEYPNGKAIWCNGEEKPRRPAFRPVGQNAQGSPPARPQSQGGAQSKGWQPRSQEEIRSIMAQSCLKAAVESVSKLEAGQIDAAPANVRAHADTVVNLTERYFTCLKFLMEGRGPGQPVSREPGDDWDPQAAGF